jgi:hypothetical protein
MSDKEQLRKQLNDEHKESVKNKVLLEKQKYENLKIEHDTKVKIMNDLLFKNHPILINNDEVNEIDKQIEILNNRKANILKDMQTKCPHEHPMFSSYRSEYNYPCNGNYHFSICNICKADIPIKYNNETFSSYQPNSNRIKRIDKVV